MMVVIESEIRIEVRIVCFEIPDFGIMMCKNIWHHKYFVSLVNFYNNKDIRFSRILHPEYKM